MGHNLMGEARKETAMSIQIRYTDADGSDEVTRTLDDGTLLEAVITSSEVGAIGGVSMPNNTTLRNGDHVEATRKSGKAG